MDEYNGVCLSYSNILIPPKNNISNLQTLFKLHLRTEYQAGQSTIYRKWFTREQMKKLVNDFKRHAQNALFFISIERIKVSYPSPTKQHQELWTVEKSATDLPGVMKIHIQHSPLPPKHWNVLFEIIPIQDVPLEFHDCLLVHKIKTISVGIAGVMETQQQTINYKPFFGVPLPDTISLPIHLHCSFILSDDRRSMRYDEDGNGNPESKFNKWLLTKKFPLLYLQFLSSWNSGCPMKTCPWWPKGPNPDRISQAVIQAMDTILPTSHHLVCNTYSGSRIAPSKAYFLQPFCPKGLLLALLPEDLAITPPGFSSHLLKSANNNYLVGVLRDNADSIRSMYKEGRITVEDVVSLARFLKLSLSDSLGLPLLPLADGSLAILTTTRATFYCPPREQGSPWLPFPPHHFLHPVAANERAIYDPLQVHELGNEAISKFISHKIPIQDTLPSSPDLEKWFEDLWRLLSVVPQFRIEDPAFRQLPLVPTHNSRNPTRISLQRLDASDILFIDDDIGVPLDACVALGITIVTGDSCRKQLKEVIRSRKGILTIRRRKAKSPGIHRPVIKFFMDLPLHEIPSRFQGLSHSLLSEFSQWFQRWLGMNYGSLSNPEKAIVKKLPLWECIQAANTPAKFVSVDEAVVIPEGVHPDVVRIWPKGSAAYIPFEHLPRKMKEPDILPTFYANQLQFPPIMRTVTITYKSLLRKVLSHPLPQQRILVPDDDGKMSHSDDLYLHSCATFTNAFNSQGSMFLHHVLRDLEQQLRRWGLISTLTGSSFRACALAIHQDNHSANILFRAQTVFRAYNTEMPPELMRDRDSRSALRNLRFIPRRVGDTRYGSIPTDGYHSLPIIVSPSEIVDPKFLGIAWSQRATCFDEPSMELRSVNDLDSVWEPTVGEVVRITFFFLHSPLTLHFRSDTSTLFPRRSRLTYDTTACWLRI